MAPLTAVSVVPAARLWDAASFLVLAGLLALYAVLLAFSLQPAMADEGIYAYQAFRMSRGGVPYRDFFLAHPPLHVLPAALLFWAGGFVPILAKLPTFLAGAVEILAAFVITRRLLDDAPPAARAGAGTVAAAALLFSHLFLRTTAYDTGIGLAGAWLAVSAVLLVYRWPLAAGLAAGGGLMTTLPVAPVALVLAAASGLAAARRPEAAEIRRGTFRFVLAATAVVIAINLAGLAMAGRAFVESVYLFHLAKPETPREGILNMSVMFLDDWSLFAAAVGGAAALLLADRRRRWAGVVLMAMVAVQVAFVVGRPRVFLYYFHPAYLPAAVLAGTGLGVVLSALRRAPAHAMTASVRPPSLSFENAVAVLAFTAVCFLVPTLLRPARALAPDDPGGDESHVWRDAPGIGGLNRVVRSVFWQDRRPRDRRAGAVTKYLWTCSRSLDGVPAMVAFLQTLAAERPGITIFGEGTTTSFLSLRSGVPILADYVDTNVQRYSAGVARLSDVFALLDSSPDTIVILSPRIGIGTLKEVQDYVGQNYESVARFDSGNGFTHFVYRRRR